MSSYCATSPMSSAPWAKGDGGLEVVDHDADVVHPLDRHVASMPSVDARRHRASARARESSERPWVTCWANARRHPPDASSRTQRSPLLGADGGEEVVDRPGRIATGVTLVDHAPADVAEVVFAVHRDPDLVARPLAAFEPTLLHGDAKPHNLGLGRDTVIAIDWGDLTGFGPPAAEIAWYAACAAGRLPCSPDDVFTDYQDLSGAQIDPAEIDLALVGALAQLGFYLPPTKLDWWCHRVRSALERRHF
jgi:hypothetical protein